MDVISGYAYTLVAIIFLAAFAAIAAVPVFACLWREGGCLDRRRQRRAA